VKNKWKVTLKDGLVSVNGKEYLFAKCQGCVEGYLVFISLSSSCSTQSLMQRVRMVKRRTLVHPQRTSVASFVVAPSLGLSSFRPSLCALQLKIVSLRRLVSSGSCFSSLLSLCLFASLNSRRHFSVASTVRACPPTRAQALELEDPPRRTILLSPFLHPPSASTEPLEQQEQRQQQHRLPSAFSARPKIIPPLLPLSLLPTRCPPPRPPTHSRPSPSVKPSAPVSPSPSSRPPTRKSDDRHQKLSRSRSQRLSLARSAGERALRVLRCRVRPVRPRRAVNRRRATPAKALEWTSTRFPLVTAAVGEWLAPPTAVRLRKQDKRRT
jgi:hypothetical protein